MAKRGWARDDDWRDRPEPPVNRGDTGDRHQPR
jgi:hypothetical protein